MVIDQDIAIVEGVLVFLEDSGQSMFGTSAHESELDVIDGSTNLLKSARQEVCLLSRRVNAKEYK